MNDRLYFREPIPEIFDAARNLDEAVTAYLRGLKDVAETLICHANMPIIRDWTESIWGKNSPYVQPRPIAKDIMKDVPREKERMPSISEKRSLHLRDGYHCRFCGIPVVRKEIRQRIMKVFPDALPWGRKNTEQHAAFQAMWAQYDHILPHSKGGNSRLDNIVVTCAPCNFGRMNFSLEEVGISDPRLRAPVKSSWDGLERFKAVRA